MRVGLIIDSAADLPYSFIEENEIHIMPVTVRVDGKVYVDDHSPITTQAFYESGLLSKGHAAETEAYSTEQIRELFLEQIVTKYDFAFLETITQTRSLIYENSFEAMHRIVAEYRPRREAAGLKGPFSMRVVDSKSVFAGQGLLAAHTLHLIKQGIPKNELRHSVEAFTDSIHVCLIPRDLYYLRERARRRGDNSVPGFVAFLSKLLNITPLVWGKGYEGKPVVKARSFETAAEQMYQYAARRVRAGLLSPYVCVSGGMDVEEIRALPGFDELHESCKEQGVELLVCRSGITSSIYLGPGTLGLALAAPPHAFADE